LQDVGAKLGGLIEKEHAFVGEANLPGPETAATSNHTFQRG
jgi:hypothetical protein